MSGVIQRNLKIITPLSQTVFLRSTNAGHTHTHSHKHTHIHTHIDTQTHNDSVGRNAMRYISPKTHTPLDIIMENVHPHFNFDCLNGNIFMFFRQIQTCYFVTHIV